MNHLPLRLSCVLMLAVIGVGCERRTEERASSRGGEEGFFGGTKSHSDVDGAPNSEKSEKIAGSLRPAGSSTPGLGWQKDGNPADAAGQPQAGADQQPPADRKIIFTADIRLKVADFPKAEQELQQLLQVHQGYSAHAEVSGNAGGTRHGIWKVRVPVVRFAEFREATRKIGELVSYSADAREVTDEYFDLRTRAKNKEAELAALRKIFDKASGKIDEVLAVQRELSRAQGELELMKGRQRVLDNLTELTTVTVHIAETSIYLPPRPVPPTAFDVTVGQTFFGSIDVLLTVGKALALAVVALAPWLPLIAVSGGFLWFVSRRRKITSQEPHSTGLSR
jgi:hypothetical protein